MSKIRKIFIKPKAYNDLEGIYSYSIKEFGIKKAKEYVMNIDKAFKELSNNPNLGKKSGIIAKNIRIYPMTSHLIFYRESKSDYSIIIVRILHKKMHHTNHIH